MLNVAFLLTAKTVWNPLRMNTERCRREEGHNSYPLECRLSDGRLFRQNTTKILSTRNSRILMMSSSAYFCPQGKFCYGKGMICSVVKLPQEIIYYIVDIRGKVLLYSSSSRGMFCYIVDHPRGDLLGEGLLYDTGTLDTTNYGIYANSEIGKALL